MSGVYMNFDGNCEAAITLYSKVFGFQMPQIMRFGDVPSNPNFPPMPEEIKNFVMQANFEVVGLEVRCSDACKGMGPDFKAGNNLNMFIETQTTDETQKIFDGLKDGGKILLPLEKTFFSDLYGMVEDKFGVVWQIRTFK